MSSPNSNLFLSASSSLDTLNTLDLDSQDTLALNNQPSEDPLDDDFWKDFANADLTDDTFVTPPSVSDKLYGGFCYIRKNMQFLKNDNAVLQNNLQSANDKIIELKNKKDELQQLNNGLLDKVKTLEHDLSFHSPALLEQINDLEKAYTKEFTKNHIESCLLELLNKFDLIHNKPNGWALRALSNACSGVPTTQDIDPLLDYLPFDVQQCIKDGRPFNINFNPHSKPDLRKSLFDDLESDFQSACKKFSTEDKQILINLSINGDLDKKSFVTFVRKRKFSQRKPSMSPKKSFSKKQKKLIN